MVQNSKFRWVIPAALSIATAFALWQCGQSRPPRLVLWAWERPENLNFIDPRRVSVAFLARTIRLRAEETIVKPRLQPLKFAVGTELTAVARIETEHAALSASQLEETVSAVKQTAQTGGIRAIQIDFDAKVSERDFYRELLQTLRRQIPATMPISITALASWCIHDDWLSGLPINEAVPMLFRLGVEREEIRSYLTAGKTFRNRFCLNGLGVSTDEPIDGLQNRRPEKVYVFNPRPWTEAAVNQVLKEWR